MEAAKGDHLCAMREVQVVQRRLLERLVDWSGGRGMASGDLWEEGGRSRLLDGVGAGLRDLAGCRGSS